MVRCRATCRALGSFDDTPADFTRKAGDFPRSVRSELHTTYLFLVLTGCIPHAALRGAVRYNPGCLLPTKERVNNQQQHNDNENGFYLQRLKCDECTNKRDNLRRC